MAQPLRAHIAFPKDMNLILASLVRSSPHPVTTALQTHRNLHLDTHTYIKEYIIKIPWDFYFLLYTKLQVNGLFLLFKTCILKLQKAVQTTKV